MGIHIINHIGYGQSNAVSLKELVEISGWSGRKVRNSIEEARNAGYIILNLQDGKGYFQIDPANMTDADLMLIKKQYNADKARAISIFKRLAVMNGILKEMGAFNEGEDETDTNTDNNGEGLSGTYCRDQNSEISQ